MSDYQIEAMAMFKESIKKMVDKFDYEHTDYIFLECVKIFNKYYAAGRNKDESNN